MLLLKPANKTPPAEKLGNRQHQFVIAFLERQVDGIVIHVHKPESPRLAESNQIISSIKRLRIQIDDDLIAVTKIHLPDSIPIRMNGSPSKNNFRPGHARLLLLRIRRRNN